METEYLVLQSKQEEHDAVIQRYMDEISRKDKHNSAADQQLANVRKKLRDTENRFFALNNDATTLENQKNELTLTIDIKLKEVEELRISLKREIAERTKISSYVTSQMLFQNSEGQYFEQRHDFVQEVVDT